ncbi:AAA family ATPase [Shinella sumterensis]|uniref:AAA family ATPase n=1 Tax=Shinella sumterensis TaxID=1967501 RepID=A0AA50CM83_9HYPH|nr:AAA family ATPase [Shinella sumterensis]WLR98615.1 AAA family ATPase [Shinella sumterensis]
MPQINTAEQSELSPTEIRLRLLENGYLPIPVDGKRPRISGWSSLQSGPADIKSWERAYADHRNTGILTGNVVAIDIDALDEGVCEQLVGRLLEIRDAGLAPCRTGKAPKTLFVFRSDAPRQKQKTGEYLVNGQKCQIEVLAAGQQFVGFGIHPDTEQPYLWSGGDLLSIPFADLPEIAATDLDAFLSDAEVILAAAGTPARAPKPKREATPPGETFWRRVNSAALASPELWVRDVFPSAKQEPGTGAWRVTSADLGRGLQEDISIHTDGIRDFGTEETETPISIVQKWGGQQTPRDAAFWLCDRLGHDPEEYGWHRQDLGVRMTLGATWEVSAAANDDGPALAPALSIFDWTVDRFVGAAPPVEYLVDGVIPMGVPGMVSAAGDTGKSYALLELHRRVAFGSNQFASPIFGGKVVTEGTSVMITSEDDANEVHRRIAALDEKEQRYTAAGKRMIIVPLPSAGGARAFWKEDRKRGLLETDDYRGICDQLLSIPDLRLITFDPLASFAHLPLNEDPTAGQFVCSSLARLASETKATVLVAHHMRKSKSPIETLSDAREAIRGSTALVDGLRLAYAMWPADEVRAKRVCKSLGIAFEANKVVLGGVVKANGAARRAMSTYARNEAGLLIDRSAGLGASAPAQGDLRAALVISVEAAAAAGAPFTKTGANGLFELRERLPEELRRMGKARLDALAADALERGEIVRVAARGEKTAKWLDVPTGMFAAGIGTFTAGMPR